MNRLREITLFISALFLVVLLGGCALTLPASEALVFQKDTKNESKSTFTSPAFPPPDGSNPPPFYFDPSLLNIYFSTTLRPIVDEELAFARDKFSSFIDQEFAQDSSLTNNDLSIRNAGYLSLAIPLPIIRRKNVYWSLNLGIPVLGTDVTTGLGSNTYVTANLGFLDGELIVQRKLIHTDKVGISIGGYYRAERRGFEITNNVAGSFNIFGAVFDGFFPDRIFYNHILGGRLNGFVPLGSNAHINLRAAPGYALNLKKPVVNLGVTFWLDLSE